MRFLLAASVLALGLAAGTAHAQVELKAYANTDGSVDVQKLTCKQLANTFQEDANFLIVWYSGWYNGLGHKHSFHLTRTREIEHNLIEYCKSHEKIKIIQALAHLFKKGE